MVFSARFALLGMCLICLRVQSAEPFFPPCIGGIRSDLTGSGAKVAILDSGISMQSPSFAATKFDTLLSFTGNENKINDSAGHGTFVAGIIAGSSCACSGIAPNASLSIFRVFSDELLSYTSWVVDALNYAMFLGVDVVNLSNGSPDFNDEAFRDKIEEVTAAGAIIVSAVGNDGPGFGTSYAPASMGSVVAVGGLDRSGNDVATFSSRGMSLEELPRGIGLLRPDVLAPSQDISSCGFQPPYECTSLSGTSLACPLVSGAVAILLESMRIAGVHKQNVAAVKQVLHASSTRLNHLSIYAQGAGALNITRAIEITRIFQPHVSCFPDAISNRQEECPFMWPYCLWSIYHSSQAFVVNITVLNSISLRSWLTGLVWIERDEFGSTEVFTEPIIVQNSRQFSISGKWMHVQVVASELFWPYVGHAGIIVSLVNSVHEEVRLDAELVMRIVGDGSVEESTTSVKFRFVVSPTPLRSRRLLWDLTHSISYPSSFIPRDDLSLPTAQVDWRGDHPFTNYRGSYELLHTLGYHVEFLTSDWTSFDAEQYLALVVVDPEEAISRKEEQKLRHDLNEKGLSLLLLGEWFDEFQMFGSRFVDENTRSVWHPAVAGANVLSINRLLLNWGGKFGAQAFTGTATLGHNKIRFASGNVLSQWPESGAVLLTELPRHSDLLSDSDGTGQENESQTELVAIGGFLDIASQRCRSVGNVEFQRFRSMKLTEQHTPPQSTRPLNKTRSDCVEQSGKIIVFGDSACAETEPSSPYFAGCHDLWQLWLSYLQFGEPSIRIPHRNSFLAARRWFHANSSSARIQRAGWNEPEMDQPYLPHNSTVTFQQLQQEAEGRAWEFSRISKCEATDSPH